MTDPHLLVDISAHGFGHLAQVAPVIEALRHKLPALRLSLRSALPRERLARRIAEPFAHLATASDFGFVMRDAVAVDLPASARRYRSAHADWEGKIEEEAAFQRTAGADLVLANASYLALAGAARAGLPCAGLCSLNWADLFAASFAGEDWAEAIHAQMLAAYNAADVFLRLTPGMPMAGFRNRRDMPPVVTLARESRAAVRARLAAAPGLDPAARWVLVAMGGLPYLLPVADWPPMPRVQWLLPALAGARRSDLFEVAGEDFSALLAAADAVVTKPGYGTFVEAACHGTPVLYVPRENWAEELPLVDWLRANGRCASIDAGTLHAGAAGPALEALMAGPRPQPAVADGAGAAAAMLLGLLDRR